MNMKTIEEKNLLWRKAAILGSIWAASEIVLGSFLHNIRLPFKGEILTAIGIAIMIAGHRLWPERGLLWRAGLICAAMKSISPSANLTGPMVAIAMEGLLADFGNRVFGQNNFGRIIGGGLAMTWAITHKLVNYLIHYGSDFMAAINETLQWFIKRFAFAKDLGGTIFGNVYGLLGFAMALYFVFGIAASLAGILSSGRKFNEKDFEETEGNAGKKSIFDSYKKPLAGSSGSKENYSLLLLALQLAGVITIFSVGNKMPLVPFTITTVLYAAFAIWKYNRAKKLALRWGVWLSVIIASAIMGFILGKASAGIYLAERAIIITFAFCAIGTELSNPKIRIFIGKAFGSIFFDTLEYSFGALPGIIAAFPPAKTILRQPLGSLNKVISSAPYWLENAAASVIIITGRQGGGKTTLMHTILEKLKQLGQKCGGFIAEGTFENGKRTTFTLVRADNGEKTELSRRQNLNESETHSCENAGETQKKPSIFQNEDGSMKCGPFLINKTGIEAGLSALSDEALKGCRYVFIDEIGPLELQGLCWADSLRRILSKPGKTVILSVRESALEKVKKHFGIENAKVFDISASADEIMRSFEKK